MKRPDPKKNDHCDMCDKLSPLLMPFGWIPGWPVVTWELLCLDCRTSIQCSRWWNRYGGPAYHMEHSPDPDKRAAYEEWLAVEEPIPAATWNEWYSEC